MRDHNARRWLLVALVAAGVSAGLSGRPHPVGAASPVSGHTPARPWRGERRQVATLPTGLAAVARHTIGRTLARPGLAATLSLSSTWTQQAELTSTAQTSYDAYGWSVALSGNTAVIGAAGTAPSSTAPSYGAVYVFTRTASGVWSQQAELLDPGYGGGQTDAFGTAVALNGTTLAVGAPGAGGLGAVYLYGRSGNTWTQQAVLTPTDATQPESFATALALSGNTLVVGADYQNNGEGAVYVYVDSNGTWSQQAELRYPGHYLFADFGSRLALWGTTLLVSALQTPVAFVYVRSGSTWSLQAALWGPHPPLTYFGVAVALWGNTALVGSCCANVDVTSVVDVFTRSGSTWRWRAVLTPPGGPQVDFGEVLALSGQTAVVGTEGAYVYVGNGATWALQAQLMPSDRPPHDIGAAVALDGNSALVADPCCTPPVGPAGFVFVRSGADWTVADTTETTGALAHRNPADALSRPSPERGMAAARSLARRDGPRCRGTGTRCG